MLGRLIQGYARGGQLESATEESHTRALLWPELQYDGRAQSVSPPSTPFGSPSFRVSPFDDRAGLELNELKDLRLIIAQDAFGTNDRPLVLLDTHNLEPSSSGSPSPKTFGSLFSSDIGSRNAPSSPVTGHARNRSSTVSGASASWTRPIKEQDTTDHLSNILDCMFGVTSATKSGSSTKMHLLPGDRSTPTEISPRTTATATSPAAARTPLMRARTATHTMNAGRPPSSPKEPDVESRDSILITRMFPVTLPDSQDDLRQHRSSNAGNADPSSATSPVKDQLESPGVQGKKPKLVEKKTPVYAAALLCYLPRPGDARPGTSTARPMSRASAMASSYPNSYGSDSLSSWTILSAIPDHLSSPETSAQFNDQSIEVIVKNWDVILRSLVVVERAARARICDLLQEVNSAMIFSAAKAPKGPSEQRTNQRNVYLRSSNALVRDSALQNVVKHALWRVSYALRIPRVASGFGLDYGGPWLDEARYLVRVCGNKQQNFFLFNLLTAFLGNHTDWLECIGPDRYRKQFRAMNKGRARPCNFAARTVIICDNRSMARRLIFLLASFLPRSYNVDALARLGHGLMSPLSTPDIGTSSPISRLAGEGSMRRHGYAKSRDGSAMLSRRDVSALSTSASSTDSISGIGRPFREGFHPILFKSDGEPGPRKHPAVFSPGERPSHLHKTNATSSGATSNAGTPVPHFSSKHDSYFPEGAVADGDSGGASADLARILRRDSTSQPHTAASSINWGSLMSNMSGLWGKKQQSSSSRNETAPSSLRDRRKHAPKTSPVYGLQPHYLQQMVDEAADLTMTQPPTRPEERPVEPPAESAPSDVQPPRMRVDDKDGVVDVDINLPGFISWDESKGPLSPSIRHDSPTRFSIDGAASSYSSRSTRFRSADSRTTNVAGYLRRYHEDFILQGVKPYPELYDEIKQSMSQEPALDDDSLGSFPDEEADGKLWVNVCSTLLVDSRTFSIERLTLQRRVFRNRPVVSHADSSSLAGTGNTSNTSITAPQLKFSDPMEERFVTEPVMDFDSTLTDAIERVLNEGYPSKQDIPNPARADSRALSVGTTASARTEPLEISGSSKSKKWSHLSTLSQADCRQAVVGALEDVVRSVSGDLTKHQRTRHVDGHTRLDGDILAHGVKQDNVLREGVKKWVLNIETQNVW
ncbi:hypothetical protein ABEF93_003715 [Exophiala dermatitidis]